MILDSTQADNFKDRYVLGEQLGWGRFGIIRACSDKLTGDVLACKSIAKDRLVTQEDVCSVKLEIEILTKLSGHENVVDLKAVYEDEDYVHLLMELCVGGELFHWIEKKGRLSEHEARTIFKQLMEVVVYYHDKGIVHRDLKPENVLIASKTSSSPIKLADFGLATYIKPGQTLHGTVGSPFYIAPEVLAGGYNQAADVWSAGVILYILLSGMPPFWGKTKSTIFDAVLAANLCFHSDPWDQIATSAKDLILGMLCFDPLKRLTATQVLAHSWIKDTAQETQESPKQDSRICQLEVGSYSFSNLNLARDQDFSFSDASPLFVNNVQEDSPIFSCRTSFSSPLINQGKIASLSGAIYSDGCSRSNSPEFFSPIPSMPSFTFSSPSPGLEQINESLCFKTKILAIDEDLRIGNLFPPPGPAHPSTQKFVEMEQEHRSGLHHEGGTSIKASSWQSNRNHSIGLGELNQVDLVAAESVIRWASCTEIPSLRSSLVW